MNAMTFPEKSVALIRKRRDLAPEISGAFRGLSAQVFRDGAIPARTKELIAVAVAHVTQCPDCIDAHARRARESGASEEELMEAIWVAAVMRAGAAYAHSIIALQACELTGQTGVETGGNGEMK